MIPTLSVAAVIGLAVTVATAQQNPIAARKPPACKLEKHGRLQSKNC